MSADGLTEEEFPDGEDDPIIIKSKRVFINHADSYIGSNIASFLSQCAVGMSSEEIAEDDDDEDDEGLDKKDKENALLKEGMYRIIGTLSNPSSVPPDYLCECIQYEDKEDLIEHFKDCDIIIYNITEDKEIIDEAVWAVSYLTSELDTFETQKMFVLISTCLTWANTKPMDPEDPDIPFTEDEFRRRKPHNNFKEHVSAEKVVTKMGKANKQKFETFVIAAGVPYGMGESTFHFLFKEAWLGNKNTLPVFGKGRNIIPTIHVKDLASVVLNVLDTKPPTNYLVAVDDSQTSMKRLTKAISKNLGSGDIEVLSKSDALLVKDLPQNVLDSFLMDIRMESVYVKDNMNINWISETGIIDNIVTVIKEYKETRKLLPMRIMVLGAPATGKTTLSKLLCDKYKLHHLHIKKVIDDTFARLEASQAKLESEASGEGAEKEGDEEEEEEDLEDDGDRLQEDVDFLEQLIDSKKDGRIDDQLLIRIYKDTLKSMKCQNQGYVLDGFPKTYEQAKELFSPVEGEEEEEGSDGGETRFDKSIMPEVVLTLQATNEFLKDRIMNLPEEKVQGTHNTEEEFTRRLQEFRTINVEDETVLNYYDELEVHPIPINVNESMDESYSAVLTHVGHIVGTPRNYGPTKEELEEEELRRCEEKMQQDLEENERKEQMMREEEDKLRKRKLEWAVKLDEVKRQEREQLEEQSLPMRNYLMRHVMPTLTSALIDVCKVRPQDPVDYLAEFLFQNNPDIE